MSAAIRAREWAKLQYADPAADLRRLRRVETEVAHRVSDPRLRALRTSGLKPDRLQRDAALFAHGMSSMLGLKVYYAPIESSDFDFVTATQTPEGSVFTPVQLKELVPPDLNPNASLDAIFESLHKYVDSADLVVAIYLNRRIHLEFSRLVAPKLPVAEVWLFGGASDDQSKWLLYGDVLHQPTLHWFAYPA